MPPDAPEAPQPPITREAVQMVIQTALAKMASIDDHLSQIDRKLDVLAKMIKESRG